MPATLTLGGGAFGLHSSGRASVRDKFSVKLCPFNYHGLGGVERMPASLYSQRLCFWYACQRVGRASVRDILSFCVFAVKF